MGWAARHIARLQAGETISFRPHGFSMVGKVESGQLVTVIPVTDHATLAVDDIVLCKIGGIEYLHLIKAIQGDRIQIGNNRGRVNGWTDAALVFGKCIRVEP